MGLVIGQIQSLLTIIAPGQATMAASVPVVIASNQSALSVSPSGGAFNVQGTLSAGSSPASSASIQVLPVQASTTAPTLSNNTLSFLSCDLSGNLRTLAAQSGTWNIGTLTSVTNPVTVVGKDATGVTPTVNPIVVAGIASSGGTVQPLKTDTQGALQIAQSFSANVTASWTSATTVNTTLNLNSIGEYANATVVFLPSGSLAGGQIVFEASVDNVTWVPIDFAAVAAGGVSSVYYVSGQVNPIGYQMFVGGFNYLRARLSVVISGTGAVGITMDASTIGAESAVSIDAPGGILTYGPATPSDAFANPTGALTSQSFLMGWNGTTWDRLQSDNNNSDGESPHTQGVLNVENYPMGFNGTTFDRQRSQGNNADALATGALGILSTGAFSYGFNGTTWDRLRSSTANGLQVDVTRVQGSVTVAQATAANLLATVTQGPANTLANAWSCKITDATNGPAAVKAASTAAVAADPALVVAVSPNNTVATAVGGVSSATVTQVPSSASSVTLLASAAARNGCIIFNDSTQILYIAYAATASSSAYTFKLQPQQGFEITPQTRAIYTGIITGIWASANGNAYVTSW